MVGPALAAWAAAALTPSTGPVRALGAIAAALAVCLGAGLARRRPGLALAALASVLCAAAAVATTVLAAADLHRGPIPALAKARATAEVTLRVTGDPFRARSAPGTVVVPAVAEEVAAPGADTGDTARGARATRVRTPVVVMATASAEQWLRLIPSTRVTVMARLAPPDVLRAQGPPRVVAGASLPQRTAAALRAGLREAAAPLPADARALLPGLVVGDTSAIPADLTAAFKATDLAHLTAVSGANLTIVLCLLIGPPGLAIRAERRGAAAKLGIPLRWTAWAGGALTVAFVLVCRPSPSVLRSAVCGLITLLAIGTGRRRSLLPALATAVLLLVLYQPDMARSYGFVLSVLAAGSLLTLAPGWTTALIAHRVPPHLAAGLAAAGAAQAVCGPVLVLLTSHVSLVGVPCNLLAEPAVGAATVLGFAALAVHPVVPSAAGALAWLAGWPAGWIAAVARHAAALPGAEVGWPGGPAGGLLLVLVTVAAVGCGRPLLRRPWLCTACVLLLLFALLRPVPLPMPRPEGAWPPAGWRFAMCDVGQGDALALATGPGSAVVVDTGPDPAPADRCLRALRVTTIPLLILTHFHADHVDGLPGVLRGRRVGAIETSVLDAPAGAAAQVRKEAAAAHVPELRAQVGEERRVGPVEWRVLWPPPAPDELPDDNPNDASVALLVRTGGLTLLLMGDLEPSAQEEVLAEVPDLPRVDVLKVAHHGSAHQDPALFARVRPRLALISVGAGNRYGHPSPRTVDTLRALGAVVLRTDTDGPVAVTGDSPGDLRAVTGRGS